MSDGPFVTRSTSTTRLAAPRHPTSFAPNWRALHQVITALNIPIYVAPGFEADDVIGTLARQATAQKVDTYIITGDTDTLQLVDDAVRVLLAQPYGRTQEAKAYDLPTVVERYKGLQPSQLADLRGLKGDASDNIPGVKGIGEAGAIQLLNQFGSVEGIYEHLDEVPNRYRKVLEGQADAAAFSKRLAVIRTDVPVTLDLELCRLHEYDRDGVVELFRELQFGSLLRKLPGAPESVDAPKTEAAPVTAPVATPAVSNGAPQQIGLFAAGDVDVGHPTPLTVPQGPTPTAHGDYQLVTTRAELDNLAQRLRAAPIFAFDVETTALLFWQAEVVGISLLLLPVAPSIYQSAIVKVTSWN